jgi:hypothetical protein
VLNILGGSMRRHRARCAGATPLKQRPISNAPAPGLSRLGAVAGLTLACLAAAEAMDALLCWGIEDQAAEMVNLSHPRSIQ